MATIISIGIDPTFWLSGGIANVGARGAISTGAKTMLGGVGRTVGSRVLEKAVSTGTTLGLHGALRSSLVQEVETGKVDPLEMAKAATEGFFTGTMAGPLGLIPKVGLGAEILGFAEAEALLQGRAIPTPREIADAGVTILGIKAGHAAASGLANLAAGKTLTGEQRRIQEKIAPEERLRILSEAAGKAQQRKGRDIEKFVKNPSRTNAAKLGVTREVRNSGEKRKLLAETLEKGMRDLQAKPGDKPGELLGEPEAKPALPEAQPKPARELVGKPEAKPPTKPKKAPSEPPKPRTPTKGPEIAPKAAANLTQQERTSMILEVGLEVGTGKATGKTEQSVMDLLKADTLGEVAPKLRSANETLVRKVHALVMEAKKKSQDAAAAEVPKPPKTETEKLRESVPDITTQGKMDFGTTKEVEASEKQARQKGAEQKIEKERAGGQQMIGQQEAPPKKERLARRGGLKAAEDAVIEQLGGAVEPDLFGPGQFGDEIGGIAALSFVKGGPSEALAKAVGEEILRKTGWKKLPPGIINEASTSNVEDVLSDIKDQGHADPESTLADIIISNRESGSRAATLRNIENLPEEQIHPAGHKALKELRNIREGADTLGNFISPGEPIDAMGATDNPNYEIAPDGTFRRKVRSASDLVGGEQPVGEKSLYASPNKDFEDRYQKARHGLQKRTIANKMRQFWDFMGKITHRGALPELPRTRQFGEARSALQAFKNAPAIAVRTVEEILARTLKPLSSKDYDLFGRSVLLSDLVETDGALPFGLDAKSAATEANRIKALVAGNPRVQAAIEFRGEWMEKMKGDYIAAHKAIGVDFSDRFKRQNYFRHQVLYWANLKEIGKVGAGGPPRMRTDRGWLKKRSGSVLDINANYIQAEWEVATQMVSDTWRAKAWARIQKQYDIRPKLLRAAKQAKEAGDESADWRDFVPETHDEYQFRPGRSIYMAPTIQESVAQRLFEAAGEQIGLTIEDIRRIPAMGSEFKPVVLPTEVTKQLAQMEQVKDAGLLGMIDKLITVPMKLWKTQMLQSPRRALPYNFRNASEIDKVAVVNPTFVFEIDGAVRDLWKMYTRSLDAPAEIHEWTNRGGANSLVRVNELARVDELKRFQRLLDKTPKSALAKTGAVPGQLWRLYWEKVGLATDFRESILRYAVYRDYLKQIQSSKDGKTPRNFGASNPEEVRGIVDPRDKAFRLSADLLIDYSDISVLGQFIRDRAYPFWSFQEGNARAYLQATKNIASNNAAATKVGAKIARLVGGKALFMGPALLMKLGKVAILYTAFQALLASVNRFLYPDEDDQLPKGAREKAHITLGKDKDGRVRYFSRLGTAGDFLEWFGADGAFYDFRDVMDGRRSIRDIAIDYAKSPLNKMTSGISPFVKVPLEVATKRSTFPDVTKPGRIRDRAEHLFRSLALDKEYRQLTGKPMREGYAEGLAESAIKKVDPGSSAYYRILDEKRRFRAGKGLGSGYSDSERSEALFNYKQAIRFDDKAAATRYLSTYMALGGTKKGLQQSLDLMHPLGGLSRADKREFVDGLREEDRLLLDRATQFYRETLNPPGSPGSKERIPGMAHRLGTLRPKDRDKRADWGDRQAEAIEWFTYQGFSISQIRSDYRKYLRKRFKTAKTRREYMRRFNRNARKIGR